MTDNICKFVPYDHHDETIHTLYFVYEQNFDALPPVQMVSFYKLCIVVSGKGVYTIHEKEHLLKEGDIFFVFPSVSHSIRSENPENEDERLQCIYVSYLGIRANQIMEKIKVSVSSPVYSGFSDLIPFWKEAILHAKKGSLDLISESVLLYTLSFLCNDDSDKEDTKGSNISQRIKKYIDENFADPDLSLDAICEHLHYNRKYISSVFKKHFKVGINEYLNSVRIHEACVLIDDKMTSVKNIAAKCGYSDQYYFSRVFKKHHGVSPREYIIGKKEGKI